MEKEDHLIIKTLFIITILVILVMNIAMTIVFIDTNNKIEDQAERLYKSGYDDGYYEAYKDCVDVVKKYSNKIDNETR